jgi:hypothetical protein
MWWRVRRYVDWYFHTNKNQQPKRAVGVWRPLGTTFRFIRNSPKDPKNYQFLYSCPAKATPRTKGWRVFCCCRLVGRIRKKRDSPPTVFHTVRRSTAPNNKKVDIKNTHSPTPFFNTKKYSKYAIKSILQNADYLIHTFCPDAGV